VRGAGGRPTLPARGREGHRGHHPRSAGPGGRGAVPGRSFFPHQRGVHPGAAVARARGGGRAPAGRTPGPAALPRLRVAVFGLRRPGPADFVRPRLAGQRARTAQLCGIRGQRHGGRDHRGRASSVPSDGRRPIVPPGPEGAGRLPAGQPGGGHHPGGPGAPRRQHQPRGQGPGHRPQHALRQDAQVRLTLAEARALPWTCRGE